MRKKLMAGISASIILAVSGALSPVCADNFKIDPEYTTISFRIKHIMGYQVGAFRKYDGTIKLNEKNDALESVEANVEVASLDTHHEKRDVDLRSEMFFDAAKYPKAQFVGRSVSSDQIKGDLTLHGVTKEVAFDYQLFGVAMDQRGRTKVFLSLNATVNRKDFGITYNTKTDDGGTLLGDDVELWIDVQGVLLTIVPLK